MNKIDLSVLSSIMVYFLNRKLIVIFICFLHLALFSQNETKKWYFGDYAALDFMTNPPTAINNNTMQAHVGCTSIADGAGNLQFYSNGVTIYNQLHVPMANGTGLFGALNTTQPALAIKQPGQPGIYYVFTTDVQGGPNGLRYSIVNMNLAAGIGSVTVKNVLIHTPSTEKLAAVRHCNGTDVWVMSHDINSNVFRALLLTSAGLSPGAVTSSVGAAHTGTTSNWIAMKFSPNGRKLCSGTPNQFWELYDFDNATGLVSNPIALTGLYPPRSIEFSPDGTKLYGAYHVISEMISQWNLCSASDSAMLASSIVVNAGGGPSYAMQLAADGKIYVGAVGQQQIGVINNPNNLGTACNSTFTGVSVGTGTYMYGLPAFEASYFNQPLPAPTIGHGLAGQCSTFTFNLQYCRNASKQINSLVWDFGDLNSGSNNSSTLSTPTHSFSSIGTFSVKVIVYYNCSSDTIHQIVNIANNAIPVINVVSSHLICQGQSIMLVASGASTYTWSGVVASSSILVSPSVTTTYTVVGSGTNSLCTAEKTVTVNVVPCTGISHLFVNENNLLKIFPNPSNGIFQVELNYPEKGDDYKVQISNLLGQTEISTAIKISDSIYKVELAKKTKGVYILQVLKNDQLIAIEKIVVD